MQANMFPESLPVPTCHLSPHQENRKQQRGRRNLDAEKEKGKNKPLAVITCDESAYLTHIFTRRAAVAASRSPTAAAARRRRRPQRRRRHKHRKRQQPSVVKAEEEEEEWCKLLSPIFFSSSFAAAACVEISPSSRFLPVRFLCLPQAHVQVERCSFLVPPTHM